MKKLTLILPAFFCLQIYAQVFDFSVSDCDIWGRPTLVDRKSGKELSENPLVRLYEEYSSPDFESKIQTVIDTSNSTDDIVVLCAIWANVAESTNYDALRAMIVKKTTSLDIEELNTPYDVLKSSWGAMPPLDTRLSAYLTLMLADRIGIIPGSPDGEGSASEMIQGMSVRYWFGAYTSGMATKFRHVEKSFWGFPILAEKDWERWRAEFEVLRQILSYEFDVFEFLRDESEDIDEYAITLGENHSGIRLLRALQRLKENSPDAEREILNLANDFFVPAYPFAEKILLQKYKYKDAAYFHYLAQKNPTRISRMGEFFVRNGARESVEIEKMKTFLNELLGAKMFEEAKAYGAYISILNIPQEHKKEIDNYTLRRLVKNGCNFDRRDVLHYKKTGKYIIPIFEERFAQELRKSLPR